MAHFGAHGHHDDRRNRKNVHSAIINEKDGCEAIGFCLTMDRFGLQVVLQEP
jgi:hypothetical protein